MKCRLGMKKCTGCLFAGSVHGGCVCHNWGGVDHRSGVDNGGCVDNRVGNSNGGSGGGERSSTVVGDLSDVAVDRVRMVVHVLDSAIRKGNRVGALSVAGTIAALSGVEVGVGVVVSDGVVVSVGGDLVRVHLGNSVGDRVGNSVNRGVVSRGSVDNRGSVVDNRGSVHNRSSMVDNRGSVNHRGGMGDNGGSMGNRVSNDAVGKAMSNNTVGDTMSDDAMGNTVSDNTVSNSVANNTVGKTMSDHTSVTSSMEGVGVLSNSSNVSSEGLGLRVVSDLSLEGLGDGHMGSLSSSNSDMCNRVSSMSDKAVSSNQAVSGEDLGSGGGGSHQGGDAEESLKDHTFRNCLSTLTICHSPSTFMLVGCW